MGTTLTGTTPQDTYDSLIKVTDNGPLSGTAKYLSDGLGNDSVLALSTTGVGIGTTSLAAALDIRKDSGVYELVKIQNNTAGALYRAVGLGGGSVDFGADDTAASTAIFRTAGSERMRITAAGNVGIGTSAPTDAKLQVVGAIQSQSGANYIRFQTDGLNAIFDNSVGDYFFRTSGFTTRLNITSDGYVRLASGTGGIQFNGDTAAANALDDYEEGTFTATLKGSSSDPSTPVTTTANYTKIGRQVTISIMFANVNTTGASGSVTVLGVPFSCVTAGVGSAITENFTFGATRTTVSSLIDSAAATTIRFSVSGNDTSFENLSHNAGTGRYLYTSITYTV